MEDWSYQMGLPSINKEFPYLLTYLIMITHTYRERERERERELKSKMYT